VITAVDTNIVVDLLESDTEFGIPSRNALRSCSSEGPLIACDVVYAEIAGYYSPFSFVQQALGEMEIAFSPLTVEAALRAGTAWKAYRERGGPRTRVAPDFLIGAHASTQADRLLTRDSGFYRTYFKHLRVFDPTHR
jgi:predicted nucleic acid-binding protein